MILSFLQRPRHRPRRLGERLGEGEILLGAEKLQSGAIHSGEIGIVQPRTC